MVSEPSRVILTNYCIMASSALLWYDVALTFTAEVERIWCRESTYVTVVYLIMRYTAVLERAIFVLEIMLSGIDSTACSFLTHTNDILYVITLLSTATVIAVRVYGISAKNWKYLLVMGPLSLVRPILYIIETTQYKAIQAGRPLGCAYVYMLSENALEQVSIIASATMIASHGILIVVTAIKAFSIARLARPCHMKLPLVKLLKRDGVVFLLSVVFNLFVKFCASPDNSVALWLVWPYFYEVTNVIIIARFILDVRGLHSLADPGLSATNGLRSHRSLGFVPDNDPSRV
ncbi:hypothetical protein C8Q74DRAFT_1344565 [Fomes fomentarius]|nr:hypothetical protein C8Q74DRAFT_1344565 [Fomes fomentarius]